MIKNEPQVSNQVSETMENEAVSSDLLVNNLVYRVGNALSLVTERTTVRYFPQTQNMLNASLQTAIFDMNSGVSYSNIENGYLTFDVQLVSGATPTSAHFGCGSAMNLIKSVILKSRSGTEIARADYANRFSRNYWVNQLSPTYLRRAGLVEGWSATDPTDSVAKVTSAGTSRFVLPLCRLAPFFDTYRKNQKLPSPILSGLHIELVWEDTLIAFNGIAPNTASISNYNITNIALMLDCLTLTDDTLRSLNVEFSKTGGEIIANQYYMSQYTLAVGETQFNAQIRKSVSQAESVNLFFVPTANILNIDADSFASPSARVTSHEWRLGSLYYPKMPIVNVQGEQKENYMTLLQTYNKLNNVFEEPGVSYTNYVNGPNYSINACFERDQQLQCSGQPVNNSRVIESLLSFSPNTGGAGSGIGIDAATTVFVVLNYLSVLRTFIDNVSVAI